jgi:hypothetical protein
MRSTNIRSRTEFHLFIFDTVWVIICLVKSVFYVPHGWRNRRGVAKNFISKPVYLRQKHKYWCERFMGIKLWTVQTCRELVEYDENGGRPKATRSEVNIAALVDLVKNDSRIASRMISESVNMPKTIVLSILKEDLGKRKFCARFVPRSLRLEQREDRVTPCQCIIPMTDANNLLFLTDVLRKMRPGVLSMTPNKATEYWMGWWDIRSAQGSEIPKVPHQEHIKKYFRPSRRCAQGIHSREKKSKCRILERNNGSPPEAHSTRSSSWVLF